MRGKQNFRYHLDGFLFIIDKANSDPNPTSMGLLCHKWGSLVKFNPNISNRVFEDTNRKDIFEHHRSGASYETKNTTNYGLFEDNNQCVCSFGEITLDA